MSKFAVKKSGAKAKQEEAKNENLFGGKGCRKHGKEGIYICSCQGELVCEECLAEHAGYDHEKTPVQEVIQTFEQSVNARFKEADNFYSIYRGTKAGQFFNTYIDFFETCSESADQLKVYYN